MNVEEVLSVCRMCCRGCLHSLLTFSFFWNSLSRNTKKDWKLTWNCNFIHSSILTIRAFFILFLLFILISCVSTLILLLQFCFFNFFFSYFIPILLYPLLLIYSQFRFSVIIIKAFFNKSKSLSHFVMFAREMFCNAQAKSLRYDQ